VVNYSEAKLSPYIFDPPQVPLFTGAVSEPIRWGAKLRRKVNGRATLDEAHYDGSWIGFVKPSGTQSSRQAAMQKHLGTGCKAICMEDNGQLQKSSHTAAREASYQATAAIVRIAKAAFRGSRPSPRKRGRKRGSFRCLSTAVLCSRCWRERSEVRRVGQGKCSTPALIPTRFVVQIRSEAGGQGPMASWSHWTIAGRQTRRGCRPRRRDYALGIIAGISSIR